MILLLKLVTGEEVIADVEECDDCRDANGKPNSYKLKNPVRIGLTQEGAATMPLSAFSDCKEITIEKQHVIFTTEPEEECKNSYSSHYGSGIITASNSNLCDATGGAFNILTPDS